MVGVAAAGAVVALLLLRPNRSGQSVAEETRRALRQQGFKTDLADFNFSISAELRAREAALTNADLTGAALRSEDYARRAALREGKPELLSVVGSNSAIVVWKQNVLRSDSGEDIWPTLREVLGENQETLDAACKAASSGTNQVVTGEEPEIATFEVPANYAALTNLGSLELWIDLIRDVDSYEGGRVGWLETRRATNGICLLVWNTIYESPGKHALQLGLLLDEPEKRDAVFFTAQ